MIYKILNRIRNRVKMGNISSIDGKGNIIQNEGHIISSEFRITGNNNTISIQKGTLIKNVIFFLSGENNNVSIGENCSIKNSVFWIEDGYCNAEIGDMTTIEGAHLAVTEACKLEIGKDCMLANGLEIRTGDSHPIFDIVSGERLNNAKNVTIGNHVWLGNNVVILKGVVIHDGSIVGTNTIITKEIGANELVAGASQKIIRTNVTWKRQR